MSASSDNGSGPAPGEGGRAARGAPRELSRAAERDVTQPGRGMARPERDVARPGPNTAWPVLRARPRYSFSALEGVGEADFDASSDAVAGGAAAGEVEAVGFWQPFCFDIAVPTLPD